MSQYRRPQIGDRVRARQAFGYGNVPVGTIGVIERAVRWPWIADADFTIRFPHPSLGDYRVGLGLYNMHLVENLGPDGGQ